MSALGLPCMRDSPAITEVTWLVIGNERDGLTPVADPWRTGSSVDSSLTGTGPRASADAPHGVLRTHHGGRVPLLVDVALLPTTLMRGT